MFHKPSSINFVIAILIAMTLVVGGCRPLAAPEAAPAASPPAQPTGSAPASPSAAPQTPAAEPVQPSSPTGEPPAPALDDGNTVFAIYQESVVQVEPDVYHEDIAPDFSNVYNPFALSDVQIERLVRDGFVVSPGMEKEFFTVYEKARYANVPIFITSDSLLHSYHLLFDKVLRTAEVQYFIPLLKDLNRELLQVSEEQYQALQGSAWSENARRVVAFVGVASRLLDPAVQVPDYASDLVAAELALIDAADGIRPSPLFPGLEFGEDYTQYIPRGHYTLSQELKDYFKSMMWYGRMTFRLKTQDPEVGRDETRSALLLAAALRSTVVNGSPALDAWADLYNPTAFFVGRSDDLTVIQYLQVMDSVYGPSYAAADLVDEPLLDTFITEANKLPPPRILGMVIGVDDDEEETTKGMRFMGQRFVPDAYIFRQLIYRNVGTPDQRRGLPKGLDLVAAMGSERAYQILDELGETSYLNYPEQMAKVRSWLSDISTAEWTETLYNSWLFTFYPLLETAGEGYPAFMQSQAWQDKQLNTVLGSWAELKHDTILYAKQVYAEMGGGLPPPEPVPPRGYVEPVPQFYARLAALTTMTHEGLSSRGLLSELDQANLQRLYELATAFQVMAEKELRGESLTEEEYHLIRFYGGELEHLVMAAADTDNDEPFAPRYMDEEPQAAVVADVATDPDPDNDGAPNPVVLEEAVGRIQEIHVVVPIHQEDGSTVLQVAKGGVFSYYEFPWPADDRLTDEKWRSMLDEGDAPPTPEWTGSFFVDEGEYSELQLAVSQFQKQFTDAYWSVGYGMPEGNQALQPFMTELEDLRADGQYMGRQLVQSHFSSFDIQSGDQAVVTTREVWLDSLYDGGTPEFDTPPAAQRGPYTRHVTYTIVRSSIPQGDPWVVAQVAYKDPPPDWELNE